MRLALRGIVRRPGRAATAIAGVGLAIALAVTMFSLTEGVRASTRDLVSSSGIDVFLYPEGTNPLLAGNPNAPAGELAGGRALAARIAEEPGVAIAAPMLHEPVYVHANGRVSDANSLAFVPRSTQSFILPTFLAGHRMEQLDDPMSEGGVATGEMIMNENLATILGVGAGDEVHLSLSPSGLTSEILFHVTGITAPEFESPQEKTVYVHLGELQSIVGKADRDVVDFIGVKLAPEGRPAQVAARIEADHPVEAFTNDDLVGEVSVLTSTFEGFARMVGLVTLGVALLFVSTIMILVVHERTGEIGALRAIGFSQARVFRLVLAEAFLLVIVAALVGFALGWLGAIGFDGFLRSVNAERTPANFHFTKLSWPLLVRVSGLVALMALVAGLFPAWRASRMDVLAALRSV